MKDALLSGVMEPHESQKSLQGTAILSCKKSIPNSFLTSAVKVNAAKEVVDGIASKKVLPTFCTQSLSLLNGSSFI